MPVLAHEDVEIAYEVRGDGPPVVLIQGVGVPGCGWGPQVDGLCNAFKLLTNDNRGMGASTVGRSLSIEKMADDVRGIMDQLGWESAHVVGHSMGGVIAQQLALDIPQRVRSLALLCTFARGKDGGRPNFTMMWAAIGGRIGTRAMRRRAFMRLVLTPTEHRTLDLAAEAITLGRLFGRDLADQPLILMKQAMAMGRHDSSSRLNELKGIPTLVLSGTEDVIAKPAYGRAIAAGIPDARYIEWDNAAHGLPIRRADEVNALLAEHWQTANANWTPNRTGK